MRIEMRQVCYEYGGTKKRRKPANSRPPILRQLDVVIDSGEMVAVAGRSGSGKSTFLQLLKGFAAPTDGELLLDGDNPYRTKIEARFDRIGYVFQYPEHQLFAATVAEDIAFGLRPLRLEPESLRARVHAAMEAVGLDASFAERSPLELSGGEKRRVAIAGVIVLEPEVLLLDEPTAGLDLSSREALFELLGRLNRERGISVVWVSHQLEEILVHADRLLVLYEGGFAADGVPSDLLSDDAVLRLYDWDEPDALQVRRVLADFGGMQSNRPWDVEEAAYAIVQSIGRRA